MATRVQTLACPNWAIVMGSLKQYTTPVMSSPQIGDRHELSPVLPRPGASATGSLGSPLSGFALSSPARPHRALRRWRTLRS